MPLIKSLLTAIVRADAEALVMHVGERPYVVATGGHLDLSTSPLTLDAMSGMLSQLLPADALSALSEFGAVEHYLQPPSGFTDQFDLVAARGGDDIWIEIRRKRMLTAPPQPIQPLDTPQIPEEPPEPQSPYIATAPEPQALAEVHAAPDIHADAEPPAEPEPTPIAPAVYETPHAIETPAYDASVPQEIARGEESVQVPAEPAAYHHSPISDAAAPTTAPSPREEPVAPPAAPPEPAAPPLAPVVPLTRTVRIEVPPRTQAARGGGIERLLAIAAARGASVLYLTASSRPFIRVEGDIRAIDGEAALTSADVEAAVLDLMPEGPREAHGRGEPAEWVSEFDGVGRIRCTTFRDYHGTGALFHFISAKPMSVEQLGLAREIQALAMESDGLVVVAAPRASGKSTLMAALVDQINRQHGGYVVTLERQIRIVHENRLSLVSQREVRGAAADAVTAARAALRENPDVLVVEDVTSPEMAQVALDAAGSGLLVFLSITAASTANALVRLVELFPPDRRKAVQGMIAERLRGAVSQVLLRKTGGGRVAARELLLATRGVTSLIAEGQLAQLAVAIDSGRRHGMVPLNDALLGYLRAGAVDPREAYRKADDRAALVALLKRSGVDTSFLERLA